MLGWLLLAGVLGAAVITICVAFLNSTILRSKIKENGLKNAAITEIVHDGSIARVSLDAIDEDGNERKVEIQADDYDRTQIYEGKRIYT